MKPIIHTEMDAISSIDNTTKEELLKAILESSPNIIIFALDTEYRYLAFNEGHKKVMLAIWGQVIELGTNMLEVISREDDRLKAKELFDKALNGEYFIDETEYGDETLSRKYWQIFYSPMYDDKKKKVVGLTCFNLDISQRRNIEISLKKTASQLTTLIDSIPDMVWMKDIKGRYIASNPAHERFFNAVSGELIGKTDYDFMDKDNADACTQSDEEAIKKRGISIGKEVVSNPDGKEIIIEIRKMPVFDSNNTLIGSIGIGTDITEKKKVEEKLKLLASVFTSAKEGIVITDVKANILDVNEAYTHLTGYSKEELIGQNVGFLKSGKHDESFYKKMWEQLLQHKFWSGEIWNRRKNGEIFVEKLTVSAISDSDGEITSYVGLFSDITSTKEYEFKLEKMAFYDSLTGLPNRLLFAERIDQAVKISKRLKKNMAVCYLDLDGFKPINDNHGHTSGDDLLIEIAGRIEKNIRESDTAARIGGDEFAILLLNIINMKECQKIVTKILKSIEKPYKLFNGQSVNVSASLGFTLYPQDDNDPEQLLKHADQAMYEAKERGKNRYVCFNAQF